MDDMKPLIYWKNTFVRRMTLVMSIPFLLLASFFYGGYIGATEYISEVVAVISPVWKGK